MKTLKVIGQAIKDSLVCRRCHWSRPNPDCSCGFDDGYKIQVNWEKVATKLLTSKSISKNSEK